jgi:hypothetical protein
VKDECKSGRLACPRLRMRKSLLTLRATEKKKRELGVSEDAGKESEPKGG